MTATILDGQKMAAQLREEFAAAVARFRHAHGFAPAIAVAWAGDDPASQRYARWTRTSFEKAGFGVDLHHLPETTSQGSFLSLLNELNHRHEVHGILILMPLPSQINRDVISRAIAVEKDLDGIHPTSAGLLYTGTGHYLPPATPTGGIVLLERAGIPVAGKHAVVVGRSPTVGRPMAMLLLERHATVTVCHSRTSDLASVVRQGDIVVTAVGRPGLVTGAMIRPGAVVIDFGVNVVGDKLTGDVDFASAVEVASAITPVPGGTGPLTVAMLMQNTLRAAEHQLKRAEL